MRRLAARQKNPCEITHGCFRTIRKDSASPPYNPPVTKVKEFIDGRFVYCCFAAPAGKTAFSPGLEGVIARRIGDLLAGFRGRPAYRGYDIYDLATQATVPGNRLPADPRRTTEEAAARRHWQIIAPDRTLPGGVRRCSGCFRRTRIRWMPCAPAFDAGGFRSGTERQLPRCERPQGVSHHPEDGHDHGPNFSG